MKRKEALFAVLSLTALILTNVRPAWASSETDALINKLVEKKILTVEEAQEVRNEMAAEAKPIADAREVETKETVKKMAGGSWLDKVKWGGDLRLRHESQLREPAVDRNRERFRLRFGFKANPVDPLEVGVRLATGTSGDPLSTNQSFTATFDKKAIFVDQAYGKYTPWKASTGPLSGFSMTGGKMENPFVTIPEGVVWDNDVTPEGAALQYASPIAVPWLDKLLPVKPFGNVGLFQISELANDAGDPALVGYQAGADVALPLGMSLQSAIAYYDLIGVRGVSTANVTGSPAGNTTVTEGSAKKFASDYNMITTTAKLSLPEVWGVPSALVGDYTFNNANKSPTDDTNVDDAGAYTFGAEVGKVTEKFGSWKAYLLRKRVESDATFGALTDSDFGGGGTNHKGYIMGLQMGLNKYASVGVKYFRTDEIEGTQNRLDTFQADLQLKY